MYILLVFLALGSVNTHDINVGSITEGKKVFEEHFQASPAVWRQAQNVTINTTDDEVISRIVVTDLREDKDGDAKIVDGGEGQKKVTIELKSPTVLRGYDFNVEVYAAQNKDYQNERTGPAHPSEFKSNAGSLNTPNPGSTITPQSNVGLTAKLPETPKTQSYPINAESKQSNARVTRDTEVQKLEENRPKVEHPSVFGQRVKPEGNVPVTSVNRQFSEDTEHDVKTTKNPTLKTSYDEIRHVRDTHEASTTARNPPKYGSFDIKTSTTTRKTPRFNLDNPVTSHPVSVANEGRDLRATQPNQEENASPTLISSPRNPTVYTPNFEANVPSLIDNDGINKDKLSKDQSRNLNDQKRSARDTQTEAKEINTPNIEGLANPANKRAENVTQDEERQTRSAQEGPKITPLGVNIKEVTTKAASTVQQDDDTSTSSLKPPGVLTKSQNFPVPYPYEATTKFGSTTKSSFKRDTVSQEAKNGEENAKLNPKAVGNFEITTKVASTTKTHVKRDTESASESKVDDKNVKLNPKSFGTFETTTKIGSTTKSPVKRETESSEESKPDVQNIKLNPKSFGTLETTTKIGSTTKSSVKRETESSEESKPGVQNIKLNPKSFGTFETKTKISSTTKSPVKRDTESSEESKFDDKIKAIPKVTGSQNATTHDHKVPVVSLQ